MLVQERSSGDRRKLGRLLKAERDAMQRDRLRAVALALDGHLTLEIESMLGRSRAFVQRWVYVYRDHGIDSIRGGTAPGRQRKLTESEERAFIERVRRGPTPDDCASALRGPQLRRILKIEFGVEHSLTSIYEILKRNGFSCLMPRPKHPKQDPKAVKAFRRSAPLL